MNRRVKFLLSGPGLIGKQHAYLIQARPDCELTAVVAPATDENQRIAVELGTRFFPDFDEALRTEEIHAAIVSSPNAFHFEQATSCLERGIPVLVEKPVTDRLEDALRLARHAQRSGIPILVGHHRTYSPLLAAASSFIKSDRFGRLVAVQGSALFYKPEKYFNAGPWRSKRGGGPILINLIHEIGLLRYFCGEIKTVAAIGANNIRHFEVEDSVAISFEFINGAVGNFLLSDAAASSKSWEMTSGENPVYPHFPNENCYHFAGTNGSLDFPSMRARHYGHPAERSWWNKFESEQIAFERSNPLELQLSHFLDVIHGRATPLVTARDGYLNMLIVEAIMRSIQLRACIDVAAVEPSFEAIE